MQAAARELESIAAEMRRGHAARIWVGPSHYLY
jgi:hypothetical protein